MKLQPILNLDISQLRPKRASAPTNVPENNGLVIQMSKKEQALKKTNQALVNAKNQLVQKKQKLVITAPIRPKQF